MSLSLNSACQLSGAYFKLTGVIRNFETIIVIDYSCFTFKTVSATFLNTLLKKYIIEVFFVWGEESKKSDAL